MGFDEVKLDRPTFTLETVQLSTRGTPVGLGEVNMQQRGQGEDHKLWLLHALLQIQSISEHLVSSVWLPDNRPGTSTYRAIFWVYPALGARMIPFWHMSDIQQIEPLSAFAMQTIVS